MFFYGSVITFILRRFGVRNIETYFPICFRTFCWIASFLEWSWQKFCRIIFIVTFSAYLIFLIFLKAINDSISEYLEWRTHKLPTSCAPRSLPAVTANFNSTGFSWTLNITRTPILFIYPLFSFDKERGTFMWSWSTHFWCECLAK